MKPHHPKPQGRRALGCLVCLIGTLVWGPRAFARGKPEPPAPAPEALTIVSRVGDHEYTVAFPEAPRRAVSCSHFTTEMLLTLGLEERMVGVAWMDNEVLPEFKAALDTIPILSDRYPSQEVLIEAAPDFITGWASAFTEKNFPPAFLEQNDIALYLPRLEYLGATMDTVYQDFTLLGKIFQVEAKATQVVRDLKEAIQAVHEKTASFEPVTVFVYDSGESAPYTAGNSLPSDLIRLAGGRNLYAEEPKKWLTVQWESVVAQNPDWIIVMQYQSDKEASQKIAFLKESDLTKDLTAVQEERILVMGLADLTGGPRNPRAVETMARHFHPEGFR